MVSTCCIPVIPIWRVRASSGNHCSPSAPRPVGADGGRRSYVGNTHATVSLTSRDAPFAPGRLELHRVNEAPSSSMSRTRSNVVPDDPSRRSGWGGEREAQGRVRGDCRLSHGWFRRAPPGRADRRNPYKGLAGPEGHGGSANRRTRGGGQRSSRHGRLGSGRRRGSGPKGGRRAIRRPDRPRELPDGADPADRTSIDREAPPRRAKGSARPVLGRGVALGGGNGVDLMAHGQRTSPSSAGITTGGPVTPSGQGERGDRPEHRLAPSRRW
jgi:hypothetical protein